MSTQSFGGVSYYLTFIDDFSHKVWVYCIKHKSEALTKFKEFKLAIEKELDMQIKILHFDNGGEFTSREFN